MQMQARRLACVALGAVMAGACAGQGTLGTQGSVSTGRPTTTTAPSLSTTTAPTAPAKTITTAAGLVGWLGSDLVVAFSTASPDDLLGAPTPTTLSRYDPGAGGWQDLATVTGVNEFGFVTDGRTVAWTSQSGVNLARPDGSIVTAPALGGVDAGDWAQYRLVPLAQGGYLVADATSLDRLSPDGQRWQQQPLPTGYVALSGTSDGAWFALARLSERDREGGTILGSSISLFNAQTKAVVHVVGDGAIDPSPAVGSLLSYLYEHAWYVVGADGRPQRIAAASTAVTDQTLSTDGAFTAGGCPAVRTLSLPLPLAIGHPGLTAVGAAATTPALPDPASCAAFYGPVAGPDAAPELAGSDLDGWAWATDDRVAAVVDYGDLGESGTTQVLVIEGPGSTPLQVPLSGVP